MGTPHKNICFVVLPGLAPDAVPILPLRDYLEKQGYAVIASSFWGEAPVTDFSELTIDECIAGIGVLVQKARQRAPVVIGIGVSMGGALLIEYAKDHDDLDAVVSIGAPFKLRKRRLMDIIYALVPVIHPVWKAFSKAERARPFPFPVVPQSIDFFEHRFVENLKKVKCPVLLINGKKDPLVDYRAVAAYAKQFVNAPVKVVIEENGRHNFDLGEKIIQENILEFLNQT
jgi:esterase/lipase